MITSTGGRCLNAPNQKKKYSDISSQDNSILENSEPDENSVSEKCQNNKGLADIEDISSDEVVIESVKSEKSTQQSIPRNSFLNHLQSWKNTSNNSKPASTPKNAAIRVSVKDETDCSVKKRKSLSRQHSSSSSSSSRYCHNITSCHLNFFGRLFCSLMPKTLNVDQKLSVHCVSDDTWFGQQQQRGG